MVRLPSHLTSALISAILLGGHSYPRAEAITTPLHAPSEEAVKAAYVFNFLKFVEWKPETMEQVPGDHFVIGVIEDEPFAESLRQLLAGKTIQEKALTVKVITDVNEMTACHALYIGDLPEDEIGRILRHIGKTGVLTISDTRHFAQRGGIIGFQKDRNRVRFDINQIAANKAGIKVSSQLLKLARVVIGAETL